jgi:cysteine desulfurase/selenocysteine lyase
MKYINEGDEIITSELEHHSSMLPWQHVAKVKKAKLVYVPLDEEKRITVDNFKKVLSARTKVVALTYVSNVMGYITPVEEIIRLSHEKKAVVVLDAAQAVPHMKVDVKKLDCDFLAFSGHKMCGPTGIGVLYGKRKWLDRMPPFLGGGEMISRVTFAKTDYNELPYKFEAGTPHYIGAIGLAEAIKYLNDNGKEELEKYERELSDYLHSKLKQIEGLTIYGESLHKAGVFSFNIDNIHPFDLGTLLDQLGIAIRTGRLCADPVMDHYGCESMVRASLAFYNTFEEIDAFYNALIRIKGMF